MTTAVCVSDCKNKLGEVPVWDPESGALFWVDIERAALNRLVPATGETTRWTFPERVAAYALRRQGGFVLALASAIVFFDPTTGTLERKAEPEAQLPGNRLNDGKCDRQGRFWVGAMDESQTEGTAGLYRFDPDGRCHRMEMGIGVSNSLAWSPDDRTFYFADSMRKLIYAYDFDADSGAISHRRIFSDWSRSQGTPDGSTIDAEGYLWNAVWDGWCLVRYAPDGRIDRKVALPVQKPTSCAFGGPGLDVLYVTSAVWDANPVELASQPLAGGVFALDVGVKGLPEPRFAG